MFVLKGDGMDFIRQADEQGLLKETTVAFLGLSEVDLGIFRGKGQNMFMVVHVMTHYITLIALKAAIEKAGKADKAALIDALAGLVIPSPTGPVTIGRDHHATRSMFITKTKGRDLVTVRALGAIAPQPGRKLRDR